jgi:hypothetical protein
MDFGPVRQWLSFFFDMSTQERGRGIRTSDLCFIKRGFSRLNYLLGMVVAQLLLIKIHF